MEPDKNKDIAQRVAEILREHSLPYEEGAWERFKKYEARKTRKVVLWPYFSAAATILLAITLFLTTEDGRIENGEQVTQTEIGSSEKKRSDEIHPVAPSIEQHPQPIESERIVAAKANRTGELRDTEFTYNSSNVHDGADESAVNNKAANSNVETQIALSQPRESQSGQAAKARSFRTESKTEKNPYTDSDLLAASDYDEKPDINDRSLSNAKWDFSLELSPNIKDRNINFGGGVAVAYNLSKNVAISSGVSYVQLDAHRNPNPVDGAPAASAREGTMASYNKSLNSINTSLAGLDIPINLRVNLNSNVYASAGVSVFSVLNESRYNDVEERIPVLAYMSSNQLNTPEPAIRTVYSQESNADTPYEGKNFTGFFNFSMGYKLPIFPRLNLAVEPYLKVPIGSLSNQDMDLSNGGLKIITSF